MSSPQVKTILKTSSDPGVFREIGDIRCLARQLHGYGVGLAAIDDVRSAELLRQL